MRIYEKSFGCSLNVADGRAIASCLEQAGHELVSDMAGSDLVIVNTCAVKGPTEDKMMQILKNVPPTKKLIVTGCLPAINGERLTREVFFDAAIGPAPGEKIVETVKQVKDGHRLGLQSLPQEALPDLNLPRREFNSVISIIPICYGCLGSCSYCCVKRARGSLKSYDTDTIARRVEADIQHGCREFWLTSQDTASYGRDKQTNLFRLLSRLFELQGDFRIRVGMMTPDQTELILDDLIGAFRNEHMFRFIHLPLQSGDDEVLKKMNRLYSAERFERIIQTLRREVPDLTVATDVICGFPGETEEAFKRTLFLLDKIKPAIVNVSKFFARPGTVAAEMNSEKVAASKIMARSRGAANLARKLAMTSNENWLGWEGPILVDEVGKIESSWIGRNLAYKPVVVKSRSDLMGKILDVRIVEVFQTYLRAEFVG